MDNPNINFEEDVEAAAPQAADLRAISSLASRLNSLDQTITKTQELLEGLIKQKTEIENVKLPDMMLQLGLKDFTLSDGSKIVIKDVLRGSIPTATAIEKEEDPVLKDAMIARRKAAFDWLRKHNAESLIKNTLTCEFGKGQDEVAKAMLEKLRKEGHKAKCEEAVHPSTLNSYLRDLHKKGTDIPVDPFALFVGKQAELKAPKSKN